MSSTDDQIDPVTYSETVYVGIITVGRMLLVYVLTSSYNCINRVTPLYDQTYGELYKCVPILTTEKHVHKLK